MRKILLILTAVTVVISVLFSTVQICSAIELDENNSLYGKKICFCGDSISYGSNDTPQGRAWAMRLQEALGITAYNYSYSGPTVSLGRPYPIQYQASNAYQAANRDKFTYDYVVLEGGANDAMDSVEIGEMVEGFEYESFDRETFAGGLEHLLWFCKEKFPTSKICFIAIYMTWDGVEAYYDVAKQICEKWDVEYLDTFHNKIIEDVMEEKGKGRMSDTVHPGAAGYDILYKYIARWLLDLDGSLVMGDIDHSGTVTAADALQVLQYSVNKITVTDLQDIKSDLNEDAVIDSTDALITLQIAVGKIKY